MEQLDRILAKYTDPSTGSLHAAVFIAVDKAGNTLYNGTVGKLSLNPLSKDRVQSNSLMWIASMTKLVTAVAVMQLVERGLIALEDDVRGSIPYLKDIQILERLEHENKYVPSASVNDTVSVKIDGPRQSKRPVYRNVEGKITPCHLLCHTSGFVYDGAPLLKEWSELYGRTAHTFSGSMESYSHPLLFEPGSSWGYGAGYDWAGVLVERTTNSNLEGYFKDNIWSIIGAHCTTFHPEKHRDHLPQQLQMALRTSIGEGTKSVKPSKITLNYPLKNDLGGIGLFSTPEDYVKLLASLIKGEDQLLSKRSTEELFAPRLNNAGRTALPKQLGFQMRRVLGITDIEDVDQADHSLAGAVTLRDIPGRRRRNTVSWAGLPNTHWWIDREEGIAAALFTQLMPPSDATVVDLLIELEEALYRCKRNNEFQSRL